MIFSESDQKISSLFKCNYLKNKKHLVNFLFRFWNLHQILNIFEKKIIVVANVIPKLNTVKTWVDHSLESTVSEPTLTVSILVGAKHLSNLHESTFIIIFDHSEGK